MDETLNYINAIKHEEIPILKSIHAKISSLLGSRSEASVSNIARIIKSDISLASRILRIVNSPYYGFVNKITNIDRAIVLMGFNAIKSLLISSYFLEKMENTLRSLWRHSFFCAMSARYLTTRLTSSINIDPDDVFATALIHDIGRVIIGLAFPDKLSEIIRRAEKEKRFYIEVEKEILGINHDIIGYSIFKEWEFPISICMPVRYHHNPLSSSRNEFKLESSILYIADKVTNSLGINCEGDCYVEPIQKECLGLLSINNKFIENFIYEIYPLREELEIFD